MFTSYNYNGHITNPTDRKVDSEGLSNVYIAI